MTIRETGDRICKVSLGFKLVLPIRSKKPQIVTFSLEHLWVVILHVAYIYEKTKQWMFRSKNIKKKKFQEYLLLGLRKRNAIDNILVIFYCLHRISILRFLDLKYFLNCLLIPSPSDHPTTGIEPRFPTLQAGSLPAVPQGSPRLLEWVAYPFSKGSSWPRNRTRVSCIAGGF